MGSLTSPIHSLIRRAAGVYDWSLIGFRYGEIIKGLLRKNDSIGDGRIETGIVRR